MDGSWTAGGRRAALFRAVAFRRNEPGGARVGHALSIAGDAPILASAYEGQTTGCGVSSSGTIEVTAFDGCTLSFAVQDAHMVSAAQGLCNDNAAPALETFTLSGTARSVPIA